MILKVGPIPPEREPDRTTFLTQYGLRASSQATLALVEATAHVLHVMPQARFPYAYAFTDDFKSLWKRFQSWQVLAVELRDRASLSPTSKLPGEVAARRSLREAATAFRYLRRTPYGHQAHIQLHRIGELVGGLYRCFWEFDEGRWFDKCLVQFAHSPLGPSVGFVAQRLCSICGADFSECDHLPGRVYRVVARRSDDRCTVCEEVSCVHRPGFSYDVEAAARIGSPVVREVTLTPEPRDPSLLIESFEVHPPPPPPRSPQHRRHCVACLSGVCDSPNPDVRAEDLLRAAGPPAA